MASCSTVAEQSPHHSKVEGLRPETTAIDKNATSNGNSTLVEYLPYHPKVQCSCQAATNNTEREKRHSSVVVKQLPHHPKVEDSSPATASGTIRESNNNEWAAAAQWQNNHLIIPR
jgi:hypothetical protein